MSLSKPINWANLPWFIIEKIVYETAEEAEYLETDNTNQWLMDIRSCADVCKSWREAIFTSKTMFNVYREAAIHFGEEGHGSFPEKTNETGELLVKEGYMRLATGLELMGVYDPSYVLNMLLEHADCNTIESFVVHTHDWKVEDCKTFVRLLKMSKPRCIKVGYALDNQQCALMFWSFLINMVRSDENQTDVELIEFNFFGPEFIENITWHFISSIANLQWGWNNGATIRKVGKIRFIFYDTIHYDETTAPPALCFQFTDLCADNFGDFVNKCQGIYILSGISELNYQIAFLTTYWALTDDQRHPRFWDDDDTDDDTDFNTEDESDAEIADYMIQRIWNAYEEMHDDTDNDQESSDDEFEQAIMREEARMNTWAAF